MKEEKKVESLYPLLQRFAQSVVLQSVDLTELPTVARSYVFDGKESRDAWMFNNRDILFDDCEFTLAIEETKMHASNITGIYRFLRTYEDSIVNIKLITPVDIDLLSSGKFREFLNEVSFFFSED